MNPQEMIDLDYADPDPQPSLLERSRVRGRRIRRRRRAESALGVVVLVVAMAGGGQWIRTHVVTSGSSASAAGGVAVAAGPERDLAGLPVSRGRGPSAQAFTADGYRVDQLTARKGVFSVGNPTVIAPAHGKAAEQLMWVMKDARLVYGSKSAADAQPQWVTGRVLNNLPAEGFWGGVAFSNAENNPGEAEPTTTVIAGLVRGPVSKVVISLPGGDVTAGLKEAPSPGLGTFYWVVTDEFDSDGQARGAGKRADLNSVARTVFRGDSPVFHCVGSACQN